MRKLWIGIVLVWAVATAAGALYLPSSLWHLVLTGPLVFFGTVDFFQRRHAIRRNFPLIGRARYLFEAIRPEINQYFVESNTDGMPFSREQRSIVYQRAKRVLDTVPFGTQKSVDDVGYEWVNHSMIPTKIKIDDTRVTVGSKDCKQPYSASVMNISAMSYGSLSDRAVMALNRGARAGGFAHNTGEGGISPYHLEGGDLIWQVGTGYFGCRTAGGGFDPEKFEKNAVRPEVKMIELKLSQGAKPGHGGILPGRKVTPEIAEIRGVEAGKDVNSPPGHSTFSTPLELCEFIGKMRELSGGKPIGIKFALGRRREFLALCKAMKESGITPDYIAVDGGEGGTGAAPLEFANHVGSPGVEGLIFVHNSLVGFGLRSEIKVISAGKITTAFGVVRRLALGADMVYSARAMMLALGCIQALRCNSNHCPAGVATQNPQLVAGLDVTDKGQRVANFHHETMESFVELLGAMGLDHMNELRPYHIMRRVSTHEVRSYQELYEWCEPNELLSGNGPSSYELLIKAASSETFRPTNEEALSQL
jgi:glutamate synthase domain-containing protein 2